MRTRTATRVLATLLGATAPALPAAAVITVPPDPTVTSIRTLATSFVSGAFDQDVAVAEDVADSDLTVTSQLGTPFLLPSGELVFPLSATNSLRTKVTISGDDSAVIEVSGSFRLEQRVGGEHGSEARTGASVRFCTTEPLSFQVSASAESEGTQETYNQPGLSSSLSYNPVSMSIGGPTGAAIQAGIGAETINAFGMVGFVADPASFRPNASASADGVLEPGCHTVGGSLHARLDAPQRVFVQGTLLTIPQARGSFRLTVTLSATGPNEAESDVFTWVGPAQGAFAAEGNWQGETGAPGVPGFVSFEDADTAIVDSASAVTIDLAASGLSRALVPRGPLVERQIGRQVLSSTTLRPIGGTLVLDSLDPALLSRSLEVAGGATLLLDAGGVRARHVTLGAVGDGSLEVVGPDGFFTTLGRFGIGGEADGNLVVRSGATVTSAESVLGEADGAGFALVQGEGSLWQTGNLAVGFADAAGVTIDAGARVESENAFVDCHFGDCTGLADLERATVDVIGKSAGGTPSTWSVGGTGEIQIGPLGKVSVEGGAEIKGNLASIKIGTGSGAADCLLGQACLDLVEGRVEMNGIDVGFAGPGKMQIGPLGRAKVFITFVGGAPSSQGELVVRGPSAEPQLVSGLSVGFDVGSHGEVVLQGGARITADLAVVGGAGPGAFGRIEVREDSVLRIADLPEAALTLGSEADPIFGTTGELELVNGVVELDAADLEIRSTGILFGTGRVDGFGVSLVTNDGEIGCGVAINAAYVQGPNGVALCPQAIGSPVTFPQLNPLAASRFARALRARPPPPPVPAPGPLVVNGDATLDGTVVLQFLNGFAPRQGDAFDLIDVSGTLTGAFANVEVRGLVPDSEFAEDIVDGKLTLTALEDTEALPTVSVKTKTSVDEGKFKKGLKVKFKRKGDTSEALQVAYRLGGTARNGSDYDLLSGVIEIPARKKGAKLVIRPVPDGVAEGPETIELEVQPGENYTQSLFAKAEIVLEQAVAKKKKK